jgi:hypothetical protein
MRSTDSIVEERRKQLYEKIRLYKIKYDDELTNDLRSWIRSIGYQVGLVEEYVGQLLTKYITPEVGSMRKREIEVKKILNAKPVNRYTKNYNVLIDNIKHFLKHNPTMKKHVLEEVSMTITGDALKKRIPELFRKSKKKSSVKRKSVKRKSAKKKSTKKKSSVKKKSSKRKSAKKKSSVKRKSSAKRKSVKRKSSKRKSTKKKSSAKKKSSVKRKSSKRKSVKRKSSKRKSAKKKSSVKRKSVKRKSAKKNSAKRKSSKRKSAKKKSAKRKSSVKHYNY